MRSETQWHEIRTAADITPQMRKHIESEAVGFPDKTTLDIVDSMERVPEPDGRFLDFGTTINTPAITKVRRIIRDARKED